MLRFRSFIAASMIALAMVLTPPPAYAQSGGNQPDPERAAVQQVIADYATASKRATLLRSIACFARAACTF
jgi:hypothetical protein